MGIEKPTPKATREGSEPIPAAHGNFGQFGGFFLATAAVFGHAMVRALSNDDSLIPPSSSALYKFGDPLGRPEFAGVLATAGSAPDLSNTISLNNDEDVILLSEGYCPVLLAKGYIAEKHQFLEPIPDGSGEWRPVLPGKVGPAQSMQLVDNSAGAVAVFCGAVINAGSACCATGSGAVVADSTEVVGTPAIVTFDKKIAAGLRKFSLKTPGVFRVISRWKMTGLNGSDTVTLKQGVGTAGTLSTAFAAASGIVFASGDYITMTSVVTVRAVSGAVPPIATVSANASLTGGSTAAPGYSQNASTEGVTFRQDLDWDINAAVLFSSSNVGNKAKLLDLTLEQIS